jgi:hypothetical protein
MLDSRTLIDLPAGPRLRNSHSIVLERLLLDHRLRVFVASWPRSPQSSGVREPQL